MLISWEKNFDYNENGFYSKYNSFWRKCPSKPSHAHAIKISIVVNLCVVKKQQVFQNKKFQ